MAKTVKISDDAYEDLRERARRLQKPMSEILGELVKHWGSDCEKWLSAPPSKWPVQP